MAPAKELIAPREYIQTFICGGSPFGKIPVRGVQIELQKVSCHSALWIAQLLRLHAGTTATQNLHIRKQKLEQIAAAQSFLS
jgi:hypothetical protein